MEKICQRQKMKMLTNERSVRKLLTRSTRFVFLKDASPARREPPDEFSSVGSGKRLKLILIKMRSGKNEKKKIVRAMRTWCSRDSRQTAEIGSKGYCNTQNLRYTKG